MTQHVTVVGSGASGVHFALSLLEKGHSVRLIDAGGDTPEPVLPESGLNELKTSLEDPVAYFLGDAFEAVTLPGTEGEYYGFPPHKQPIFAHPPELALETAGFEPLLSHAAGGLAEAWTAGCYPFDESDLEPFPFGYEAIGPYYDAVARRIGVTGREDDLARFMPVHADLLNPIQLDDGSRALEEAYVLKRSRLNRGLGFYMGRSRVAALAEPQGDRSACGLLGRCLWGCPTTAFYTPTLTLAECRRYPRFNYETGTYVRYFTFNRAGRVVSLVISHGDTETIDRPVETLALAAGTLSSSRILLESLWRGRGERAALSGLMDNRQVLVPFVNLRRIGARYSPDSYQYHQLSIGLAPDANDPYVHGQVTTLTTAQAHPILQTMPMDLPSSLFVFRNARAAMGLVNLNYEDRRRSENRLSLGGTTSRPALRIRYTPAEGEHRRISRSVKRLRRALRQLGCVVPPGTVHVRPMGASVHYAGTVPMSETPRPHTTSPDGRSHDFENLFFVDGTTFPSLPAKNVTFTLMANAMRIAEKAF